MNEKDFMLWFSMVLGVTLRAKLELLKLFKSSENIYNATERDFHNNGIFDNKIIDAIINSRDMEKIEKYKAELVAKNVSFVHINEEKYPYLLKYIEEPPILLYYKGRLPSKDDTLVSIVGTRRCSSYGKSTTELISKELAKVGVCIVSGLASGIDTIAHETTLKENGYTIAVIGNGIDVCYPKENFALMNKIAQNGLILSEYPLGMKPLPHHFPRRNRIVAGISNATIVTEAPKKSGALITSSIAIDEGRDVLTFPADIFRKSASGNNELIKNGAIPITELDDVLYTINYKKEITKQKTKMAKPKVFTNVEETPIKEVVEPSSVNKIKEVKTEENKIDINSISNEENTLLELITYDGVDAQYLSIKTGYKIEKVQYLLTMLELNEVIVKTPEQKFIKKY